MEMLLRLSLLISMTSSIAFAQLPCPQSLFYWTMLLSKAGLKNTSSAVVQLNPYSRTQTSFYFQKLAFQSSSIYDQNDQQYVLSGYATNKLGLISTDSGILTPVQYQPSTFSLRSAISSLVLTTGDYLTFGGTAPGCNLTPISRIDLISGQTSLEGCVATDNFIPDVLSIDENQNILYYATLNQLIGVNLNNSQYYLQTNIAGISNIFSDFNNNKLYYTQSTKLFLLQQNVGKVLFDFSTVFSKSTGSYLFDGACFDPISQLLHGAYFNNEPVTVKTVSYFTFDMNAQKVLFSYSVSQSDQLYNYARMGWICFEVGDDQ